MFKAWRQYRQFTRLPAARRNIVFYAETRNDWHHFEPIIDRLTGEYARPVSYLTSDAGDFAFDRAGLGPAVEAGAQDRPDLPSVVAVGLQGNRQRQQCGKSAE